MVGGADDLREHVAAELTELLAYDGPLSPSGARSTMMAPQNFRHGDVTPARRELWQELRGRYLARQPNVVREGRAALLTAGVPGAGKSRAVERLGVVDEGWRRLDADVVKDYLIEDLVGGGHHDDLLGELLADGYPIMPAELATLVHEESVVLLDQLRVHCLSRGENVVIEGTLSWPPAGERLLGELVRRGYREVSIVDVEVASGVAHEQARNRWWRGRQDRIAGHGLGGRFVPAEAIDRAFPDPADRYSVCAANARALFDSSTARALPVITLTVHDSTGPVPVSATQQRHAGHLHSTRATERSPVRPSGE